MSNQRKNQKFRPTRPAFQQTHSWWDLAESIDGWPDQGRPWVCCRSTVFFFFSTLIFLPLISTFLYSLNWKSSALGYRFFLCIFLLYVRCPSFIGCCKTLLLQLDRIGGFLYKFYFIFLFLHVRERNNDFHFIELKWSQFDWVAVANFSYKFLWFYWSQLFSLT